MKDFVGRVGGDRPSDHLCVQGLEGRFVLILGGDDAAHSVWGDNREELCLKGLFHVAGAGRGDDYGVRDVGWLKGTGEELGTKEGKVVMDGKELGFCVKMINRTHLHAAGGYAEGGVLDTLEFLDVLSCLLLFQLSLRSFFFVMDVF